MLNNNFSGLLLTSVLIVGLLSFFGLFPQFDLTVSGWFYDGQWLGKQGVLWMIRNVYYKVSVIVPLLFLGMLIVACFRETIVPRRVYGFFVALSLVAPLGIVNAILKEYWGRARPNDVTNFGGDKIFTPAQILPVDQCDHNCSFVSGEGAGCFTLLLMALTMFGGSARRNILICAVVLPMGFLRIAAGGHFLSDVLGSFLVVAFCFYALLMVMKMKPSDLRVGLSAVWGDVKSLVGKR